MRKFLIGILLLFVTVPSFALNLGEINGMVRFLVRDSNPTGINDRFEDVLISSYVNMGQDEIAVQVWCVEDEETYAFVAGQREYQFKSDMLAINRLSIDDDMIEQKSRSGLDVPDSNWEYEPSTGTPSYYYVRHTTYSVIGFDVIPDTTTDGSFTVEYIKRPTQLTSTSDIPFDGQPRLYPFHSALIFYTSAMICYTDNRPTEGDRFYNMYVDRIKSMERIIRLTPDYYPSVFSDRNK